MFSVVTSLFCTSFLCIFLQNKHQEYKMQRMRKTLYYLRGCYLRYGRVNLAGSWTAAAAAFVELFRPKKFIMHRWAIQAGGFDEYRLSYSLSIPSVFVVSVKLRHLTACGCHSTLPTTVQYPSRTQQRETESERRRCNYSNSKHTTGITCGRI